MAAVSIAHYAPAGQAASDVGEIQLGVVRSLERNRTIGGGLILYPDAPGDASVGGWAELRMPSSEPYSAWGARIHLNTLWDDPAAAVALGGRSTGIKLYAQGDLSRRFWAVAEATYSALSIDAPDVTNGRLNLAVSVGYRVLEGETRTGEPLRVERNALPGLVGPDLEGSPELTRGPLVSVWMTYQAIRLLDDKQLATVLPIGESFNYLSLGARTDMHLAPGLGLTLEGYAGSDLEQSDFFFGLETALTWRPSPLSEFTLRGAYGSAVGRTGDADTFVLRLLFTRRW
jgi:hypothetical protein